MQRGKKIHHCMGLAFLAGGGREAIVLHCKSSTWRFCLRAGQFTWFQECQHTRWPALRLPHQSCSGVVLHTPSSTPSAARNQAKSKLLHRDDSSRPVAWACRLCLPLHWQGLNRVGSAFILRIQGFPWQTETQWSYGSYIQHHSPFHTAANSTMPVTEGEKFY